MINKAEIQPRDELVGYAQLLRATPEGFDVQVTASSREAEVGKVHALLTNEVHLDHANIGASGRLVLRSGGFYVSYHLIASDLPV